MYDALLELLLATALGQVNTSAQIILLLVVGQAYSCDHMIHLAEFQELAQSLILEWLEYRFHTLISMLTPSEVMK